LNFILERVSTQHRWHHVAVEHPWYICATILIIGFCDADVGCW
jgi:hypothetical protein